MAKLAASAYGEALFELAVESGQPVRYMEQAQAVLKSLEENEELFAVLNHPKIDKKNKVKTVEDIFGNMLLKDITGTLVLAVEKDRQKDIVGMLQYVVDNIKEYLKIGIAYVTTPMELTEDQKKALVAKLKQTTDYCEFEMNYSLDPSLIGGMVIRIGDRVVDTSIKSKLSKLAKELTDIRLA